MSPLRGCRPAVPRRQAVPEVPVCHQLHLKHPFIALCTHNPALWLQVESHKKKKHKGKH